MPSPSTETDAEEMFYSSDALPELVGELECRCMECDACLEYFLGITNDDVGEPEPVQRTMFGA